MPRKSESRGDAAASSDEAVKIALVWDKSSSAYIDFMSRTVLTQWTGSENPETIRSETLKDTKAGSATLFGDVPVAVVNLERVDDIRAAKEFLKRHKDSMDEAFPSGLLMTSMANKSSVASLGKVVSDMGGSSLMTHKDTNTVAENMLDSVRIPRQVRGYFLDYVGEDYQMLIPVVANLRGMSPEEQKNVDMEQAQTWFASTPGTIAPWSVDNAVFSGDIQKALKSVARVNKDILVSYLLNAKAEKLLTLTTLLDEASRKGQRISVMEMAETMGEKNVWALKPLMPLARKMTVADAAELAQVASEYESKMKGGSSVRPRLTLMAMVSEMGEIVDSVM